MFCWQRSASTARSQVWLGLPNGRFQSGGSAPIHGGGPLVVSCGQIYCVIRRLFNSNKFASSAALAEVCALY